MISYNLPGDTTEALVISDEIYPWLDHRFNWFFTKWEYRKARL